MHNRRCGAVIGVVVTLLASFLALVATNLVPGAQAESAGSTTVDRRVASGAIAAGYMNSCALTTEGSLRCWGGADFGILGQGTGAPAPGDTQYDLGDNELPSSASAIDLGAGRTARSIAMRYKHICAVLDNGSVKCWGNGQGDIDTDLEGVLGTLGKRIVGDDETPAAEAPVDLGTGRTAKAVTAGWLQSCAILDTDQVKCWGQNGAGQLGLAVPTTPVAAASSSPIDLGGSAAAISSGRMHTCALLTTGAVKCWGYNNYGQLGLGNTENVGDNETPASVGAVDLGPGRTATAIAVGYEHSCAILDNGALRCWGRNDVGQLGLGNVSTLGDDEAVSSVPTIDLGIGRSAVNVSVGYDNTCVVLDNGAVRCWGSNHIAQLGLGGEVALQPGEIAIDANYHAALGDNELPTSVAAIGLEPAVAVATGTYHSCAILTDQTLKCWGAGNNGRTGHGDEQRVGDDESPSQIDAVSVGGQVGGAITTTTSTTTSTSTTSTSTSTTSTTSTTASPTTAPPTTAPPTTAPPVTVPPVTVPPATAPPATVPAVDRTAPYLRMWRGSPMRVYRDGRVCVFLTSDEVTIAAFAVDVPGRGLFRSAVVGVGPTFPQFLCITLPRSARPGRTVQTTFTAVGIDAAVNFAFDQKVVTLTR